MRIAYLVHLNMDNLTGVFKKVVDQVITWRRLGHEAKLFVVTRNSQVVHSINNFFSDAQVSFYDNRSVIDRLKAFSKAVVAVRCFSPDVIYIRRDLFYPQIYRIALSLPLVVEINSEELLELKMHSKAQWLYHLFTRPIMDRRVKGMVFVTQELAQKGYYGRLCLPKCVVGNGIDLERYPALPVSKSKTPHLLFISSPAVWHGIDKLMFLAKQFPHWTFHLVGLTSSDVPQAPKNVQLYGRLSLDEYLPIAAQAHIGIGPLALHRKGLNEASPLKVREYLALGLPVIIGYQDTDFIGEEPFICRIPNTEDNILTNLEKIERFVLSWMGRRVNREVVTHLDYKIKETKRIAFFEDIVLKV